MLQVFVTTFAENSVEFLYSRRLKYLLDTKRHLIDIQVIDANSEIQKVFSNASATNLREVLFAKYRLIKNGKEIELPQVFLVSEQVGIKHKKSVIDACEFTK